MIAEQKFVQTWLEKIVAKQRIAHAYVFSGKQGAGKKQMAVYFSQSLLCEQAQKGKACQVCSPCQKVAHGNHPNVYWLEPMGTSLKIEQIRQLQHELHYKGMELGRKIYIIEQADQMTVQAANSLLKFLEEPHTGITAILLTEHPARLLPTILSRCQLISFAQPSVELTREQVQMELTDPSKEALIHLASQLTTDYATIRNFCQAEWFAELRKLVIQLTVELAQGSPKALFLIDDLVKTAKEKDQLAVALDMLLFWYRDLLYTHLSLEDKYTFTDQRVSIQSQATSWSRVRIAEIMEAILEAKQRLHAHVHPQLLLEQLVLRIQEGLLGVSSHRSSF